jgi:uncharacterized protein YjiS (DUF1127 family)
MAVAPLRFALACVWLLALSGCAGPAAPGPVPPRSSEDPQARGGELVRRYSAQVLADLLREQGYGSVEILEDGNVRFLADGMVYLLLRYGDGDLQLFWGVRGISVSQEAINEWNRTRRLSRAYLDSGSDPALESDLLSDAGLTREQVARFVQVFVQATHLFHGFLVQNGEIVTEPLPASGPEI